MLRMKGEFSIIKTFPAQPTKDRKGGKAFQEFYQKCSKEHFRHSYNGISKRASFCFLVRSFVSHAQKLAFITPRSWRIRCNARIRSRIFPSQVQCYQARSEIFLFGCLRWSQLQKISLLQFHAAGASTQMLASARAF